ncbi:MAG: GTP-binding protein, partial [Promethearchaeota archaeon]
VTEGPYMVRKHPLTIKRADMVVINKVDLAEAIGFDVGALEDDVREVDANIPVLKISSATGEGIEALIESLGF